MTNLALFKPHNLTKKIGAEICFFFSFELWKSISLMRYKNSLLEIMFSISENWVNKKNHTEHEYSVFFGSRNNKNWEWENWNNVIHGRLALFHFPYVIFKIEISIKHCHNASHNARWNQSFTLHCKITYPVNITRKKLWKKIEIWGDVNLKKIRKNFRRIWKEIKTKSLNEYEKIQKQIWESILQIQQIPSKILKDRFCS